MDGETDPLRVRAPGPWLSGPTPSGRVGTTRYEASRGLDLLNTLLNEPAQTRLLPRLLELGSAMPIPESDLSAAGIPGTPRLAVVGLAFLTPPSGDILTVEADLVLR